MRDLTDGEDALVWVLGTKVIGTALAHPVNGAKAARHIIDIQRLAKSDGELTDMADAWLGLQAAIGPPFLDQLIKSGEYRDICPTPAAAPMPPPLDDELTIWSNSSGERVVAEEKETHFEFVVKGGK